MVRKCVLHKMIYVLDQSSKQKMIYVSQLSSLKLQLEGISSTFILLRPISNQEIQAYQMPDYHFFERLVSEVLHQLNLSFSHHTLLNQQHQLNSSLTPPHHLLSLNTSKTSQMISLISLLTTPMLLLIVVTSYISTLFDLQPHLSNHFISCTLTSFNGKRKRK